MAEDDCPTIEFDYAGSPTASSRRTAARATARAARARMSAPPDLNPAPLKPVFRQEQAWDSSLHFGSRFVFAVDDLVYVTTGERYYPRLAVSPKTRLKRSAK